jgi:Cu/Ag efflux protein CusF
MNVRRMIVLAAGALLASRVIAADDTQQQPPSDQKSWYQKDEEKAKELGQKGTDAAKRGAQSTGKAINEGGNAATAKVVGTKTVTGKVADVSKEQVKLDAAGKPMALRVTDATKVTIDGQKATVDSLKEGDQVRASYVHSGGEDSATKLDVKRSATTPPTSSGSGPSGRTPPDSPSK